MHTLWAPAGLNSAWMTQQLWQCTHDPAALTVHGWPSSSDSARMTQQFWQCTDDPAALRVHGWPSSSDSARMTQQLWQYTKQLFQCTDDPAGLTVHEGPSSFYSAHRLHPSSSDSALSLRPIRSEQCTDDPSVCGGEGGVCVVWMGWQMGCHLYSIDPPISVPPTLLYSCGCLSWKAQPISSPYHVCVVNSMYSYRRRRIYTDEKAKVVTADWDTDLNRFLAALVAILHQDDLKNRMNSSFSSYHPGTVRRFLHIILVQLILFFKSSWCKIVSTPRDWINSVPQTAATTFPFYSIWYWLKSIWRIPAAVWAGVSACGRAGRAAPGRPRSSRPPAHPPHSPPGYHQASPRRLEHTQEE